MAFLYLCRLFLEHSANPNAYDNARELPFSLAMQQISHHKGIVPGQGLDIGPEIMACFLAHNANPNTMVTEDISVLSRVCGGSLEPGVGQRGPTPAHVQMARILLEAGARPEPSDLAAISKEVFKAWGVPLMSVCGSDALNSSSEQLASLLMNYGVEVRIMGFYSPLYSLLRGRLLGFWCEAMENGNVGGTRVRYSASTVESMQKIAVELVRRGAGMSEREKWWASPVDCLELKLRESPGEEGPLWVPAEGERLQKSEEALVEHRRADNEAIRDSIVAFKDRLLDEERRRIESESVGDRAEANL